MRYHEFLKRVCPANDLAWRKYRRREARRRIEARIQQLCLPDYAAYLERLQCDRAEAAGLAERMRVTVSRLFREQQRWLQLAREIIPQILAEKPAHEPLRIWSAGCCGGEEPYTLALLWLDLWHNQHPDREVEIIATDIDAASLARARGGIYQHGSIREVPSPLLQRYFHKQDNNWQLDERVRQMVQFNEADIFHTPPPAEIDLICCRYLVFTYFTGQRRLDAARLLYAALRPGGVLMIARKEELGSAAELFDPWPGVEGVFRRRNEEILSVSA